MVHPCPSRGRFAVCLWLTLLWLLPQWSLAATTDSVQNPQRDWQLGVSLGYGNRSNPLLDAEDVDLIAVVDLSWYGQRWFFDNGDLGFTLLNRANYTLNSVLRVNTERLFFEHASSLLVSFASGVGTSGPGPESPNQGGTDSGGDDNNSGGDSPIDTETFTIPERNYALEGGLEWLADGPWGFIQASVLHDISQQHQGYAADLSVGRSGHWRRLTWTASAGIGYRSARLNDYYYGILPEESQRGFAAYQAEAGFNYHVATLVRYYLSRSLSLGLVVQYETLSDAIADSPFVADDTVTTGYAGIKYTF